MYRLRLFHKKDTGRLIDERFLEAGELVVGRDPGVGWTVNDPDRAVSRSHCIFALKRGELTVRDVSSNGILVGAKREPPPRGEAMTIDNGDVVHIGDFDILVERVVAAPTAADTAIGAFSGAAGLAPGSSPFAPPAGVEGRPQDRFDPNATLIGLRPEALSFAEPVATGAGFDAPFTHPILKSPPVQPGDVAVPDDWTSPAAGAPASCEVTSDPAALGADLFEAFCAGAKLNPGAFGREDRLVLMRNLGAVYQQMVLGVADLLGERTSVKAEYRMERTTVQLADNNPFKWSSPARVAIDLLRPVDDGFLTGPAAVRESFEDMKKHLLCILGGVRAAVSSTLEALRPEAIETRAPNAGGLFNSKEARAWAEYRRLFGELKRQADDNPDSQINRDFRAGYEKQLAALDNLKPPL